MRQWAISVGINHYQSFQSLNYAQHDAQAVRDFLVQAGGIAVEQCLLLTDTSPQHWGKSTYPNRENIQGWLDVLLQQYLEPGDWLWFFFSGYGICQQGRDYLIPIEGSPTAISTTGIPLDAIFQRLQQAAIKPLVLLDINRNEGVLSYETVGTQTAQLANQTGTPTLLSCEPAQFSRETAALGHGLFTAALLEGLQNQHLTLRTLAQYLRDRVPALSEQYWRPVQQPVTISPIAALDQPILPLRALATATQNGDRGAATAAGNGTQFVLPIDTGRIPGATAVMPLSGASQHDTADSDQNGSHTRQWAGTVAATASPPVSSSSSRTVNGQSPITNGNGSAIGAPVGPVTNVHNSLSGSNVSAQNGSANGANGSSAQAGAQADGLNRRQPIDSSTQNHENGVAHFAASTAVTPPHSDPAEDPNEIPDALFWRPILLWGGLIVTALILGVLLRNCASFTPKPRTAGQPAVPMANRSTASGAGSPGAGSSTGTAGSTTPVAIAPSLPSQSLATNQHFGAVGTNQLTTTTPGSTAAATKSVAVPQTQTVRSGTTNQAAAPNDTTGVSQPTSALAAARARIALNSDQASPYSDAIQEAKKIALGQPDYAQAQQDIDQWSHRIMAIARQRGRQGSFDAAIMAARLVPSDQPTYTDAKSRLQSWCLRLSRQRSGNPVQRQQAKETCQARLG